MRGKRLGKWFLRVKLALLIVLAAVGFSVSTLASGISTDGALSRLSRQVLYEPTAITPEGSDAPTSRAEALLSFNTVPMKTLWLGACLGLIYCLRRTKKA